MRTILFCLTACTALSGCWSADTFQNTGTSLKKIFALEPKKPFQPHPVATAYCYHAQSDILCYREPQKGMEVQFVARQPTDSVGQAITATPAVPPSVDEIHQGAVDSSFPQANRAFGGAAQEAALSYPGTTHGSASFSSQTRTSSNANYGSNTASYNMNTSGYTSAQNSGPTVLMPNP